MILSDHGVKAVILAGGRGTRIAEETSVRPKPMIEIGGRPLLWHIMKIYAQYGVNDFIICCGYLGHKIKEYFLTYSHQNSDITIDGDGRISVHSSRAEPWRITLVDTGLDSMTGGRIRRIGDYVRDDEFFCMTYGDGVSDVNIEELIAFHRAHGRQGTVTAVSPLARFGRLDIEGDRVSQFAEKPANEAGYISGGFFVLSPKVLDLIAGDNTIFEREPLETLSNAGELMAYRHHGFWQPMDTMRDKLLLEDLWAAGAPWKSW